VVLAARGLRDPELGGERRFEHEVAVVVRRQAARVWRRSVAAAVLLTAASLGIASLLT
jgi:hypothetical protein